MANDGWRCSVKGCKGRGWQRLNPKDISGPLQPTEVTILCDEHKVFYTDTYLGYTMTLEAEGCGCCAINKLYEPGNEKPIREGQVDLSVTGALLTRTWTSGVDVLIKQSSSR